VRRLLLNSLPWLAPLALSGCASAPAQPPAELTRLGEAVELAQTATSVQECEFITILSTPDGTSDDDIVRLRNEAGERGANTVLLVTGPGGGVTRAEGYLCGD
jgi:hypothetical protein